MERKKGNAELLAPAGSYESMIAAINAGADAVYIGGNKFGARAYADNLDEDTMKKAIDYAHLHGSQIYLTINTLFKERELEELFTYLKPFYEQGMDAVIVQDFGTFALVKEWFPDLPIHVSTQMTVTGVYGAELMAKQGASRIVTARELSLEEIKEIHDNVEIEIESFVHGALCYSYSGQCLLSSLIGGRSGNRGRCAQPCRLPYEVKQGKTTINGREDAYILSPKDLCTLDLIPDLLEAGVHSLKIEGRMKSPRYTAGVVSIYRKYVDQYLNTGKDRYQVEQRDRQLLLGLFDRGGFTKGYYKQHNGKDMIALKEKPAHRQINQELFDSLDETYVNMEKKEKIKGKVTIRKDLPVTINLEYKEASVTVEGTIPERSQNQPLTQEKLSKQIKKTGTTPFLLDDLQIELGEGLFVSIQALNELRRNGLWALEHAILDPSRRSPRILGEQQGSVALVLEKEKQKLQINVLVEQLIHLEEAIKIPEISDIYLDTGCILPETWTKAAADCHRARKKCILVMPHILRREGRDYYQKYMQQLKQAGFDGVLVKTLEEVGFLKQLSMDLPLVFDYSIYAYNHRSAYELLCEFGASKITMPLELNSRELQELGCEGQEIIVYGYLQAMVSAQCIQKTMGECKKKTGFLTLKDRLGKEFMVKNNCIFCYNTIYNSQPLSLLLNAAEIKKLNPQSIRLQFTVESRQEAAVLLHLFIDAFLYQKEVENPMKEFTKGHFKRGVE